MRLSIVATITALALLVAGCGGSGTSSDAAGETTTEAFGETTSAAAGAGEAGEAPPGGCPPVAFPEPRPDESAEPPTEPLDTGTTYTLTFTTNCGEFTVTLDAKSAPQTTASLVSLARAGYFDDTLFHRIVPGFVIQGGDPGQTGGGGPGYQTVDPPSPDARYTKGVVAMAKAASEASGTSGSQFFVVTADDAGLPPEYAVVGRVTDGLDVVEKIGTLGDAFEQPTQPIVIESVTVATSP
jgi:peptidyl-prolyl cis-trans isomerase B (cyclophilin B)